MTVFYTELSTLICPDVAWKKGANSHDKSRGSSNRSGHKRLVFRVTADVVLHKRANRNDKDPKPSYFSSKIHSGWSKGRGRRDNGMGWNAIGRENGRPMAKLGEQEGWLSE